MSFRRLAPWLAGAAIIAAAVVLTALVSRAVEGRPDPGDAPSITRSFYAEKDGAKLTGRVCSEVVATTPGAVAVGLSCGPKSTQSQLGDLLGGGGQ
jgi:hypothetical protein